jgi:hypothetical protein
MKKGALCFLGGLAMVVGSAAAAVAGPPLTNVEGVGGVALNPLAYVANPICEGEKGFCDSTIAGVPQIGFWHIDLSKHAIGWDSIAANMSFFNRVEVGFGEEFVNIGKIFGTPSDVSGTMRTLSAKVNLIKEGDFGISLMPAFSAGVIRKTTDSHLAVASPGDNDGWDYYGVFTKTIAAPLPMPLVLNAGYLSTTGIVRGVAGFGPSREGAFFGNVEVVPMPTMIVGWEYEQGYNTAEDRGLPGTRAMWNAHVAWMHKDLTVVAAYLYTGDVDDFLGQGPGWVFSAQYAF